MEAGGGDDDGGLWPFDAERAAVGGGAAAAAPVPPAAVPVPPAAAAVAALIVAAAAPASAPASPVAAPVMPAAGAVMPAAVVAAAAASHVPRATAPDIAMAIRAARGIAVDALGDGPLEQIRAAARRLSLQVDGARALFTAECPRVAHAAAQMAAAEALRPHRAGALLCRLTAASHATSQYAQSLPQRLYFSGGAPASCIADEIAVAEEFAGAYAPYIAALRAAQLESKAADELRVERVLAARRTDELAAELDECYARHRAALSEEEDVLAKAAMKECVEHRGAARRGD